MLRRRHDVSLSPAHLPSQCPTTNHKILSSHPTVLIFFSSSSSHPIQHPHLLFIPILSLLFPDHPFIPSRVLFSSYCAIVLLFVTPMYLFPRQRLRSLFFVFPMSSCSILSASLHVSFLHAHSSSPSSFSCVYPSCTPRDSDLLTLWVDDHHRLVPMVLRTANSMATSFPKGLNQVLYCFRQVVGFPRLLTNGSETT